MTEGRMRMAEYIEREAVINLLANRDVVINSNDEVAYIREDVERLPAADVRPVVLCKDCKYAERVCMPDGRVWCNENLFSRLDEDFCSRGEKREES